jgi:hypothetical protein
MPQINDSRNTVHFPNVTLSKTHGWKDITFIILQSQNIHHYLFCGLHRSCDGSGRCTGDGGTSDQRR